MSREETRMPGLYYTVIDGTFRTRVDKDHPQAKMREYETRDGAKAVKYERTVSALSGYIEDVSIFDGDYGKTINIRLDENEEGQSPVIQLNAGTTYGEDFLKKAPNIDFGKEVRFSPFAFTSEEGKEIRGISITQKEGEEDVKVKNFFYDTEQKTNINGYPEPDGSTEDYSKEDWKIYFLQARKFLLAYFAENVVPKIQFREDRPKTVSRAEDVEEINPDDIPF